MSAEYYTLVTDVGHAKLTNALALGLVVTLTHFAVGDGNGAVYNPIAAQTALAREVYRAPINAIRPDDVNPTWLTVEAVIPASVGGWTVREAGIFDVEGDLIAIAKYPESVKPALDSGVGKDLYCRVILQHGNVSTVTLKIDPAVVLATREYVGTAVAAAIDAHKAAAGAHPDASTEAKGFVELATSAEAKTGTSTSLAVTPKGLADTLANTNTMPVLSKSAAYTATAADIAHVIESTDGTWTLGFAPSAGLGDGWWCAVRNAGSGTITLNPDGAELIDGAATVDLPPGASCLVVCDGASLRTIGMGGASGNPGEIVATASSTPPPGTIKANGAVVPIPAYAPLAAAIYCGDADNATAAWGYRCTDDTNPTGTRDIAGDYIVIPDLRGEFIRGADDGRGVDVGRSLWATQGDAIRNITGTWHAVRTSWTHTGAFYDTGGRINGSDTGGSATPIVGFDASRMVPVAEENRPRNTAVTYCIRY